MKQLIFAIVLVVALPIGAIINSCIIANRCDALLDSLELNRNDAEYRSTINEAWLELRKLAAYSTPYDLVRSTHNACETYLSRLESKSETSEINASLVQLNSCLSDIRRIHAFSLELIL